MLGQAPAYGFFIRHAARIKLTDIELNLLNPDSRPAFRADDVNSLILRHVKAQKSNYNQQAVLNQVTGLQTIESLDIP